MHHRSLVNPKLIALLLGFLISVIGDVQANQNSEERASEPSKIVLQFHKGWFDFWVVKPKNIGDPTPVYFQKPDDNELLLTKFDGYLEFVVEALKPLTPCYYYSNKPTCTDQRSKEEIANAVLFETRTLSALLEKNLNDGDPAAETLMGIQHLTLAGLKSNLGEKNSELHYSKAIDLIRRAANQNYSEASYFLATIYQLGLGTNSDLKEANKLFEESLSNGCADVGWTNTGLAPSMKRFLMSATSPDQYLLAMRNRHSIGCEKILGSSLFNSVSLGALQYHHGFHKDYDAPLAPIPVHYSPNRKILSQSFCGHMRRLVEAKDAAALTHFQNSDLFRASCLHGLKEKLDPNLQQTITEKIALDARLGEPKAAIERFMQLSNAEMFLDKREEQKSYQDFLISENNIFALMIHHVDNLAAKIKSSSDEEKKANLEDCLTSRGALSDVFAGLSELRAGHQREIHNNSDIETVGTLFVPTWQNRNKLFFVKHGYVLNYENEDSKEIWLIANTHIGCDLDSVEINGQKIKPVVRIVGSMPVITFPFEPPKNVNGGQPITATISFDDGYLSYKRAMSFFYEK